MIRINLPVRTFGFVPRPSGCPSTASGARPRSFGSILPGRPDLALSYPAPRPPRCMRDSHPQTALVLPPILWAVVPPPSLAFPPTRAGKRHRCGIGMPAAFLPGLEDFPDVIGRRAIHELSAWRRFALPAITDSTASRIRRPWPGGRFRSTAAVPDHRRANPAISLPVFAGSLHLASQVDHNPPTGEFFLCRSSAKRQTPVGASQSPESAFLILMTGTIQYLPRIAARWSGRPAAGGSCPSCGGRCGVSPPRVNAKESPIRNGF